MSLGARYCGSCGGAIASTRSSEFPSPASPSVPSIIGREVGGRYRILAKLGEGGMGTVYRAEQISLKRIIALKVLKPELSAEEGLVRRFNTEATLAAKLNHPNTVTLFDFGQDADGSLFIAMEYIEGKSLRQALVNDGPMSPGRALAITSQICGSLSDAHATGIVHRDLKPDNVMIFARGRQTEAVSVLDFGIAKLRDEHGNITQQPMTQAGDILGTPQYMAPEQIRGDRVDARTDIYALGVMLYEMMTARLPFEGATVMALLSKHLTDTPVAPSVRRPELAIPEPLSQLIMRCLSKSPDDRPRTMDEIEQFLSSILPPTSMAGGVPTPGNLQQVASPADARSFAEAPTGLASAPTGFANQAAYVATAPQLATPTHSQQTHSQQTHSQQTHSQQTHSQQTPAQHTAAAQQHAATIATRPRGRKGLWSAVAVLVLAGAAVAAYLVVIRQQATNQEQAIQQETGAEDTELAAQKAAQIAGPNAADDGAEPGHTEIYTDPAFNYRMKLPASFQGDSDRLGTATFTGSVDGHNVQILTTAWPVHRGASEAEMETALAGRLAALGILVNHMDWRDARTLAGTVTVPEERLRGEFVLSRRGRVLFLAAVGSPEGSASATKRFRATFLGSDYEIY